MAAALEARSTEGVEITRGMTVEVYKGRKVPVGTVGVVIWLGQKQWGWRVGVKDDMGEAHWTALSNVRASVVDKQAGTRKVQPAARPQRWDIVVILDEPEFVGKVFWMSADGERCGIAREGARRVRNAQNQLRNKAEDTRWIDTDAVCKRCDYTPQLAVVEESAVGTTVEYDEDDLGCF